MSDPIRSQAWFARHRMGWIMEMLHVYGFINREHLCRKFELSVPQASKDLNDFMKVFPGQMAYDKSEKRYIGRRS